MQGSSALQIVSALQDKVGSLSQYARGKTWVAPPFVLDKMSSLLDRELGFAIFSVVYADNKLALIGWTKVLLNEDSKRRSH